MAVQIERRRLIIIIIIGIIALGIIGLIVTIISTNLNANPYGKDIAITGYDQKIKNLPQDYKDQISSQLLAAVKLNYSGTVTPETIKGVTIRDGSNTQQVITSNKQYSGSFIVDIPAIKQSYKVQYEYSTNNNDQFMSGYPIIVGCVSQSELIYGDFNCKNTYEQNNAPSDPIIAYLPYSTLDYEIRAITDNSQKVTSLEVSITLSDSDYQTGVDQVVAQRKQEVLDWITSNGINPNNYKINYTH